MSSQKPDNIVPTFTEDIPSGEFLLFQSSDMDAPLNVRLEGESVWLSQRQISELYDVSVPTINEHINNLYDDDELSPESTIRKFRVIQTEGTRQVRRLIDHYNLEMIIALGFRVRSQRGSLFRRWANERLSEYLVKGFTMDDARLKGQGGVVDYFDELLARIRDIRASEARVYLMIREIFALATDYQEGGDQTTQFFATMQNKMHYAATGKTAAEIVQQRANAALPNMGLTSWKGGRVVKADVGTAKNYLSKDEIDTLNRITVMFLDQAEFRAQRRQGIRTRDWEELLDKFLADADLPVLQHAGRVSHVQAVEHANQQYTEFAERRRNAELEEAEQRYVEDLRQSANTLKRHKQGAGKK